MDADKKDEKLPDGFRFHPTDEELITCYLVHKISDANFTGRAIGDVDLNKCEPWDLPGKAKMGEKEFYFFSMRDRKYPTGVRTNRATNSGYWKTTGKDKEIHDSTTSDLVGMKKTLVFYRGRAPRGEKTNWVMHEYRMHSKSPPLRSTKQDEWVVCRVFQKSPGGKKYPSTQSSRAIVNPYINLDPPPQNIIHHHPETIANNLQMHANRNYVMMMAPPEFQQIPTQLSYGPTGGFTISGLNLNLGGAAASFHDQNAGGYGGDHMNNRFMGMDECGDLDNYWHSYQMGN